MMSYQIETINKEINYKELNWNLKLRSTQTKIKISLGGSKADLRWQKKEPAKEKQAQSRLFNLRNRKKKNEEKLAESQRPVDLMKLINICITRVLGGRYERRERERDKKNIEEILPSLLQLMKNISLNIQEAQLIPSRLNSGVHS